MLEQLFTCRTDNKIKTQMSWLYSELTKCACYKRNQETVIFVAESMDHKNLEFYASTKDEIDSIECNETHLPYPSKRITKITKEDILSFSNLESIVKYKKDIAVGKKVPFL